MSRHPIRKKNFYKHDPIHQSRLVYIFATRVIKNGKKSLAYRILYSVFRQIQEKTQREPLAIIEHAVRTVTPIVRLKARRVGGTVYQIPVRVHPQRGTTIAIQWILVSSRSRPGRHITSCLVEELLEAASGRGDAVRKCEEIHRLAEVNKAFARFRF